MGLQSVGVRQLLQEMGGEFQTPFGKSVPRRSHRLRPGAVGKNKPAISPKTGFFTCAQPWVNLWK
jgi:hypothetical protein